MIIHCGKCFNIIEYLKENVYRYQCSECQKLSLCKRCFEMECLYYNIPSMPSHPESEVEELPHDYVPVNHSCSSIPLPHYYTKEKKLPVEVLSDILQSVEKNLFQVFKKTFEYHSDRMCLGIRTESPLLSQVSYKWLTYREVYNLSLNLSNGLSYYMDKGEIIGLYTTNCPEWIITFISSIWNGFINLKMNPLANNVHLNEIFKNSKVSTLFTCNSTLKKIIYLYKEYPELIQNVPIKLIMHLEDNYDEDIVKQLPPSIKFKTYNQILEFGRLNPPRYLQEPSKTPEDDLFVMVYTSGSTGVPKGVPHTNTQYIDATGDVIPIISYPFTIMITNPMCHVDGINVVIALRRGAKIAVFTGSMNNIFTDAQIVHPNMFQNVPRVFSLIYQQYQSDYDRFIHENPKSSKEQADLIISPNYKNILGERVRYVVSVGSSIPIVVLDFIKKTITPNFYDHYGLTESFWISYNGAIYKNIQIKLEDAPEFNFSSSDKPFPRGELLAKSDLILKKYHGKSKSDGFDNDGWFKTGELVELLDSRTIRILSRRRMAFKLLNGEFVSPTFLEDIYLSSKYIKNIYIHGEHLRTFILAIIVPKDEYLSELMNNNFQLNRMIMDDLKKIAKEKNLASFEIPFSIHLDSLHWSVENGLILPIGKYSRPDIYNHYKDDFKKMDDDIEKLQISFRDNKGESLEIYMRKVLKLTENDKVDYNQISFSQLGGDSLSAVRFSAALKGHGINISPSMILNKNINISKILRNSITESDLQVDWPKESEIDDDIIDLYRNNPTKLYRNIGESEGENIFLTGSTGYLGTFLLCDLVKNKKFKKIYCLQRKQSKEQLKEQLKANLINLSQQDSIDFENKVVIVIGDLSQPKFGLPEDKFIELSNSIELIIHNGAIVNMAMPYHSLKEANVNSTKDIIRLSFSGHYLKKLVYVSTIGIFFDGLGPSLDFPDGSITEFTEVDTKNLDPKQGYKATKLMSDEIIRNVSKLLSIPTMIFRPGTIYSNSQTGFENPNDFVSLIINSILSTKFYPTIESTDGFKDQSIYFNLSPVDWVSRSMTSLISMDSLWNMDDNNSNIFHMVNNNSTEFALIYKSINEITPISPLEYKDWLKLQFSDNSNKENPLIGLSHQFQMKNEIPGLSVKDSLKCPNTTNHLISINEEECPIVNSEIIKRNINYILHK